MRTPRLTTNAKSVVITASTCGLISLLGTIIFFLFLRWVGYYTEQDPFPGILTGAAFSLMGGIVAGVTGIKIRITNEKLRRGICGAIAGMFSMIAVLSLSLLSIDSRFLTLIMMGIIPGASAGVFSAFYIGKPAFANAAVSAFADSAVSAAEGGALASFIWVFAASFLIHPPPLLILGSPSIAMIVGFIGAIVAGFIGAILGGLLGLFGHLIGYAGDRALGSLVGLTCGATLGASITMILLAGQLSQ